MIYKFTSRLVNIIKFNSILVTCDYRNLQGKYYKLATNENTLKTHSKYRLGTTRVDLLNWFHKTFPREHTHHPVQKRTRRQVSLLYHSYKKFTRRASTCNGSMEHMVQGSGKFYKINMHIKTINTRIHAQRA